jgi:hypothetical protein
MSTNAELKKQGEKIKEIEEGLDQVETNLKRADKQIRIFIRYTFLRLNLRIHTTIHYDTNYTHFLSQSIADD